jgi:hypothetical protein
MHKAAHSTFMAQPWASPPSAARSSVEIAVNGRQRQVNHVKVQDRQKRTGEQQHLFSLEKAPRNFRQSDRVSGREIGDE